MPFLVVALGLVFMYAVWRASRPQPAFVIEIQEGQVTVSRGNAPRWFVEQCARIAGQKGVQKARIYGYLQQGETMLRFSAAVPPHLQQRFRNAFANY